MSKFLKFFVIVFLGGVFFIGELFSSSASAQSFKDIPQSYSGYDSIEWAVKQKIIQGYTDGTYRKSDTLTEAQFAAVLARYFNPTIDVLPASGHWSDRYYNYLSAFNLYLPGHTDNKKRFEPLPRVELAKLFAKSQDPAIDNERLAVQWLYDQQITKGFGKSSDSFVDFNPTGILERGQVASFFQRLNGKKFMSIVREGYVVRDTIRGEELQMKMRSIWEGQFELQVGGDQSRITLRLTNSSFRLDTHLSDQRMSFSLFQTDSASIEVVADTIAISYGLSDSSGLYKQLEAALVNETQEIDFLGRKMTINITENPFSKVYSINLPY